jgi:hypothetical protein
MHQLGAIFGNAAGFVVPPHHKPGDVLQEQQRDAALLAQFDKMRTFQALSLNSTPLFPRMPTG